MMKKSYWDCIPYSKTYKWKLHQPVTLYKYIIQGNHFEVNQTNTFSFASVRTKNPTINSFPSPMDYKQMKRDAEKDTANYDNKIVYQDRKFELAI